MYWYIHAHFTCADESGCLQCTVANWWQCRGPGHCWWLPSSGGCQWLRISSEWCQSSQLDELRWLGWGRPTHRWSRLIVDLQRPGFKMLGAAGSRNFPTDSCKFPTEDIMGAQNFIFGLLRRSSPQKAKMGDFQPQIVYFWKFSDMLNFRGWGNWPPCPLPLSTTILLLVLLLASS